MNLGDIVQRYGRDHGTCSERVKVEPHDESKAHRCTLTLARRGRHECRSNSVTGSVFDRCGDVITYVGEGSGDDAIRIWNDWLERNV